MATVQRLVCNPLFFPDAGHEHTNEDVSAPRTFYVVMRGNTVGAFTSLCVHLFCFRPRLTPQRSSARAQLLSAGDYFELASTWYMALEVWHLFCLHEHGPKEHRFLCVVPTTLCASLTPPVIPSPWPSPSSSLSAPPSSSGLCDPCWLGSASESPSSPDPYWLHSASESPHTHPRPRTRLKTCWSVGRPRFILILCACYIVYSSRLGRS